MSVVHTSLGSDSQAGHQPRRGNSQSRRDPNAYPPGHRGFLSLDKSRARGSLVLRSSGESVWVSHRGRQAPVARPP